MKNEEAIGVTILFIVLALAMVTMLGDTLGVKVIHPVHVPVEAAER